MTINVDSQKLDFTTDIKMDSIERPSPYFTDIISKAGKLKISKPGKYILYLKSKRIITKENVGLTLRWVRLKPI